MFLIKLLRFLFGYVRFESGGGFPERFLNLCAQAHFPLWEVTSRGGTMKAFTTLKSYKKFRPYARKAGVRLRERKVRASQGRVPDNVWRRRLQGQCNRNVPPFWLRP